MKNLLIKQVGCQKSLKNLKVMLPCVGEAFWNKAELMRRSKTCHCFSMVLAILLLLLGPALADKITWSGEWGRIDSFNKFDNATIEITKVTPKNFKFTIIAVSGAHVGEMEGLAEIKGNRAFYADKEKCRIIFKMVGANLTVEATEGCLRYAGAGVYFDGTYRKGEKVPTPTLKSRGIFKTEKEEQAFRQLVGGDYELFVDSMQLIFEEDDLDGLGAKVVRGAVRGLFTIVEAIIIYRDADNMWAAVIDGDVVKYYTTVTEFQNRLPRTIERWREPFKEKKVLFMSGPKAL